MTTQTVSVYAPLAEALIPNAVLLAEAGGQVAAAASPFARSIFAASMSGVSLPMIESMIVAANGSPKSPATGKPVKRVSGLRAIEGGASTYQTWKAVDRILSAMVDATPLAEQPEAEQPEGGDVTGDEAEAERSEGEQPEQPEAPALVTIGDKVRPMVEAFTLNVKGAHKSLNALSVAVAALVADEAKALAAKAGVKAEGDKGDGEGEGEEAPASLLEQATAFLVTMNGADDSAFIEAQQALALLADAIETRWSAIEAATAPAEVESLAA